MTAPTVHVVDGDLVDQDVDAIVNAWNRNVIPHWLLIPQGVSRAIRRRAGSAPFREVFRRGPIPLGEAVVTGAGRLPHRAIVHVAGIDLLWRASERSIRACVRSAIARARERGFRSLAFPLIGAGTGGRRHHVREACQDAKKVAPYEGTHREGTGKPPLCPRCAELLTGDPPSDNDPKPAR